MGKNRTHSVHRPQPNSKRIKPLYLLIVIGIAFAAFSGVYIYNTSFEIDGTRCFCLTDDMMISMTYAKNLAHGHGLVWNGDNPRVEGITNPGWTTLMAAIHLAPLPLMKTSLIIQILAVVLGIATLITVYGVTRALSHNRLPTAAALILTAFYSHLLYWNLTGNETSILALYATGAVWLAIRLMNGHDSPPLLYLLLGAGTLVRIDMAVILCAVWLFFMLHDDVRRKEHIAAGLLTLCVFVGGQTVLRMLYYGYPLPNTYYLKMTGYPALLRMATGIYVFAAQFILDMYVLPFIIPFALLFTRERNDRRIRLIVMIIAAQMAYSIYVGGDAWEERGGANRFIAVVMPLFFILAAYSAEKLIRPKALTVITLSLCFLGYNASGLAEMTFRKQAFQVGMNKGFVWYALMVDAITHPDATIAVTSAGIIPYFSERRAVDELGKCDCHIARTSIPADCTLNMIRNYKPGHLKHDHEYIFTEHTPDVVAGTPGLNREIATRYLKEDYVKITGPGNHPFVLRKKSPQIRWDLISMRGK